MSIAGRQVPQVGRAPVRTEQAIWQDLLPAMDLLETSRGQHSINILIGITGLFLTGILRIGRAGKAGEVAEVHLNDPMAIAQLQAAARDNSVAAYRQYAEITHRLNQQINLRGMFRFKKAAQPLPLEQVRSSHEHLQAVGRSLPAFHRMLEANTSPCLR